MLKLINDYLNYSKLFKKEGTYRYDVSTSKPLIECIKKTNNNDYNLYNTKTIENIVIHFKTNTKAKNSKINAIMSFMYKVLNHYDIKTDLPKRYKLPDDTQNFRALNDVDLKTLFKYLKENESKYNLAIYFLLESGVRFNELINIDYINIDFNTRVVVLEVTKNSKKRVARYGALSDQYIKNVDKNYFKNITYSGLRHFFDKVKRKTGIKSLHAHMLRKTFATQLLKKGCPVTSIQKYLGHSDIKMTMIYLEIDIEMLDSDYNNYYPY